MSQFTKDEQIAGLISDLADSLKREDELTKQRDELLTRLDVVCEVGVISPTYDRIRAEQVFAKDDIEYDLFSAGWKAAIRAVKGTEK